MREIKFRAWDSNSKEMIYSNHHQTVWVGGLCASINNAISQTRTIDYDHVMQFIGLKDKKGKDIYTGDLVLKTKGVITDPRHYEVFYTQVRCAFALTRKEKSFNSYEDIVKCKWSEKDQFHMIDPDGDKDESLEVIGNIYEHKHLLK